MISKDDFNAGQKQNISYMLTTVDLPLELFHLLTNLFLPVVCIMDRLFNIFQHQFSFLFFQMVTPTLYNYWTDEE